MHSKTAVTLIQNGTVIDGTGAQPVLADVLIEGERITAVGDDARLRAAQAGPGLVVIEATGCKVMPGMIDSHCHISYDQPSSNE